MKVFSVILKLIFLIILILNPALLPIALLYPLYLILKGLSKGIKNNKTKESK